jgi:hypothetical protein
MSNQHATLQAAIEVASELKDAAQALSDSYLRLPAAIEREHRAIKDRDLAAIERIGEEKALIGDAVEAAFHALQGGADRLARLGARLAEDGEDEARRPVSLSECVALLERVAKALAGAGLGAQVLRHQVDGLARVVTGLSAKVQGVKPMIEQNKANLQALLESYQLSYLFWQKVAEEQSSSYNKGGVQQAAGRVSAFRSRA